MDINGALPMSVAVQVNRSRGAANRPRARLAVASIGALVPQQDFACVVHSVFKSACNLAWGESLLFLAANPIGNGPTTLLLRPGVTVDLREFFAADETVVCRAATLRGSRVAVQVAEATVWRPDLPRALLPSTRVRINQQCATQRLLHWRCTHTSVIARQAASVVDALVLAARDCDATRAEPLVARLIGWGEGLTPAGDDFLVGWLAAMDRLANCDAQRDFLDALHRVIVARVGATTLLSRHFLRLATRNLRVEPIERLLDALLCEHRIDIVHDAIRSALAIGATSGADTLSGVLAAIAGHFPTEP